MGQSHGGAARKRRISLTSNESELSTSKDLDEVEECSSDEETKIDGLMEVGWDDMLVLVCTGHYGNAASLAQQEQVLKNVKLGDFDEDNITDSTVLLHVYDLEEWEGTNDAIVCPINEMTIGGAFHAGVEVYGHEWSYGKRGVISQLPRTAEDHIYRCSIPLGVTKHSPREVAHLLTQLCREWRGGDYDLFSHNCCSFAAEFCRQLGVGDVFPAWIDRFARLLGGLGVKEPVLHMGTQVRSMVDEGFGLVKDFVYDLVLGDEHEEEWSPVKEGGSRSYIQVTGAAGQEQVRMVGGQSYPQTQRIAPPRKLLQKMMVRPSNQLYVPGASVEYLSSKGSWIPAKVLRYNASADLYDLDCKLQVPRKSIRPRGSQQIYFEGEWVEYWSTTHNMWGPTQVLSFFERSNVYLLNCRQDRPVAGDRIRKWTGKFSPSEPPVRSRNRGMTVAWEPDSVAAVVSPGGSVVADPGSTKSSMSVGPVRTCSFHMTTALATEASVSGSQEVSEGALERMETQSTRCSSISEEIEKFPVGSQVIYWSPTHQVWLEAIVQRIHQDPKSYDLNIKANADPTRLQAHPASNQVKTKNSVTAAPRRDSQRSLPTTQAPKPRDKRISIFTRPD